MEYPSTATCAICGTASPAWVPGQLPEPKGPPDFDTRPGEPLRSTIARWIQVCPECGYAAEDITHVAAGADAVVRSAEYQALRSDPDAPEQARPFLCFAHLLDKLHQHADSGWSYLHAAWVCDDVGAEAAARSCRSCALEAWQRGKGVGQSFGDDLASEFALVTDLYRRTGQFEHATVACGEALEIEDIPAPIEAILRRQMVLIQSRDTAGHSMAELLRNQPAQV